MGSASLYPRPNSFVLRRLPAILIAGILAGEVSYVAKSLGEDPAGISGKVADQASKPTLEEKTAEYFSQPVALTDRIEKLKKFAEGQALRIMLVVGDPSTESARRFVKAGEGSLADGTTLFDLFDDYVLLAVSTDDQVAMDLLKTKSRLGAEQLKPFTLAVIGDNGTVVASKGLRLTMATEDNSLQTELREFAVAHALPHPDAEALLAAACDRARSENNRVLLEDSSTYCAACRVLLGVFDRHADIFADLFVQVRIDEYRFVHGQEVIKRYRTKSDGIVPWCAILDADGKKIADWDTPDGSIGLPTLPKEFDHLEKILKAAAPKITDQQLAEMRADLEQEAKRYEQH
jgi:hypothetical protein